MAGNGSAVHFLLDFQILRNRETFTGIAEIAEGFFLCCFILTRRWLSFTAYADAIVRPTFVQKRFGNEKLIFF